MQLVASGEKRNEGAGGLGGIFFIRNSGGGGTVGNGSRIVSDTNVSLLIVGALTARACLYVVIDNWLHSLEQCTKRIDLLQFLTNFSNSNCVAKIPRSLALPGNALSRLCLV